MDLLKLEPYILLVRNSSPNSVQKLYICSMKIALIGYGKMGKTIEELALKKGHEVFLKSDSKSPFDADDLEGADVAIEFSRPDAAVKNIMKCLEAKVPVVCGTTGWYNRTNEVENEVAAKNGKLIYSSNFSIGVNIFFKLNQYLAKIMDRYDSYNPVLTETHHTEKLDSPSGTAITLAEDLLFELDRKENWQNDPETNEEILSIISYREADVKGTHEISYNGLNDQISIKHEAKNRDGFALGSILAAQWLVNQKSGTYSMNQFLKI